MRTKKFENEHAKVVYQYDSNGFEIFDCDYDAYYEQEFELLCNESEPKMFDLVQQLRDDIAEAELNDYWDNRDADELGIFNGAKCY